MPKTTSQKKISNILKLLVVIIGLICTSLVFVVRKLGGLLPLAISIGSAISGPMLGLFTLGMLVPVGNAKGAFYGGVSSLVVVFWMLFGAQYYNTKGLIKFPRKGVSIEECPFENITTLPPITTSPAS